VKSETLSLMIIRDMFTMTAAKGARVYLTQ